MLTRLWRYFKSLFTSKLDQWENPEIILEGALRDMKETKIKNRERAVQAITQKNNLQALVEREEKLTRDLEAKAGTALTQGNRELARQILREKALHDSTLGNLRGSYKQAEETAEAVKEAIRREDERFRVRTAEALAMKANMKQAEIQITINKALDDLPFDDSSHDW